MPVLSALNGITYENVDPFCCFPYIRIRKTSRSGVKRLKASLNGTTGGVLFNGLIPGQFGYVVRIDRAVAEEKILRYLKGDLGLTEAQAYERLQRYETWYGVVDGVHRLLALMELIEEEPEKWSATLWPCTVMMIHPTYVFRAFARNNNSLHGESAYITPTVYDTIKSIFDEHEDFKAQLSTNEVPLSDLFERISGGVSRPTTTTRKAARLALNLDVTVIETIGEVVQYENESIAYSHAPPETPQGTLDCRLYRKLFNLNNIYAAKKW